MGKVWRTERQAEGVRRAAQHPDEARLVEGLRRRAPEALAGLHEEYASGIYNLALRVVRHPSDAEDITQDVLIRAFERLPRDREVMLRPWLYRTTLNRCYDHLRTVARRPLAAAPQREVPSPHDPFEQSELQRLLEASLGELTRRQRAALLLKDVHGLSLVEVGACLDLTPGSVEVLLARARRAFRSSYEGRCAAAGRPVPRSAGAVLALPLLPLPPALGALPLALPFTAPPAAPLPPAVLPPLAPAFGAPLTLATGGGIGALLGLPSSVKTAVLVAAAAASLGSAELVATHSDQRPPLPVARASAAAATAVGGVTATGSGPGEEGSIVAGSGTETSAPPLGAPSPSATASATAEPSPQGSPLAIPTPVTTPSGSASPTPDAHATTPATEPPTPTPTPTTPATPSASPSPSPSPAGSPSPSPNASSSPSPAAGA